MASTKDIIDARPESIGALLTFSSTPQAIIVPVYQRFYQWDVSKILDLTHLTDPDSRDFGFIGTMVFVKDKKGRLEVVDGQQRLISLVLILCSLRDYIRERYIEEGDVRLNDLANDIQRENLLVSKSYSTDSDSVRLIFKRKTYEYFKNRFLYSNEEYRLEDDANKKEMKNLEQNYEQVKEYLRSKYRGQKGSIELLYRRLEKLKGLVVNAIYITEPAYAGEVFESINGTGVTLKLSELVKNYIFRSVDGKFAQERWGNIELNAGDKGSTVERIIKYDWQNREDISDEFEIFRSIKASINREQIELYLVRIYKVSKIFNFYLEPTISNFKNLKLEDYQNDKNHIIKHAAALRLLGALQFLRTIISLHSFEDYIQIGDYERLLRMILNFQVRAKISGIPSNDIDRMYSKTGKQLYKLHKELQLSRNLDKDIKNKVKGILFSDLKSEMNKLSSDDAFKLGLIKFSRTRTSGKDFFKYLLATIESQLQRKELIIDGKDNKITIEEIYPQQPSDDWAGTNLSQEDIYKLSNATILVGKDNGAGSNSGIRVKLPIYKKSNLKINQELVSILVKNGETWNSNAIKMREKWLADIALGIWKLNF
ncbi:MAG TPA: DUF262 domain-containing HNH endonuclease family protein [Candidatus Saccharibacteria bacterium]|nr:DUF262 domain-containing HNH endonuclease family protein [Candidatus Saccharibacteria bacterium]